ncbi:response regulator [Spirosoma validum]|uniref:Response regulator n=1 Tax=Spirosoma validum TaxID=2771355 RepID=A0A927GCB1_9BACT|nr:response regulator [Spirosoma validum]MBD2752276.1 response regulator [Spirosoma validum]
MAKVTTPRRRKQRQIPILIVEDNADQWLIIRAALTQCFPEVEPIWANTVSQAILYLETNTQETSKFPRLILCDLYLPRKEDGWALVEFLETNKFSRKPTVIILSSSQEADDIEKAYSLGVASYIVKPGTYHQWLNCFYTFRRYWWEVATLPFLSQQTDS